METITNLITGIETKAGEFLGSDYKKISYGIDVAQNRSGASKKAYAVLPLGASQDTSIGALVVDQSFSFKLTDGFVPGKLNDHTIKSITNALYDQVYGLYDYLVRGKCGEPSLVMITSGLSVGEPEYLDDDVVIIEFSFTVKHRLT